MMNTQRNVVSTALTNVLRYFVTPSIRGTRHIVPIARPIRVPVARPIGRWTGGLQWIQVRAAR